MELISEISGPLSVINLDPNGRSEIAYHLTAPSLGAFPQTHEARAGE
jgi:hypothetical protein